MPPDAIGLHLISLANVLSMPLNSPNFSMDNIAYSEQVG